MVADSEYGSAAKGSAIDLEVAGCSPVGCCFFPPLSLPCVVHYLVFLPCAVVEKNPLLMIYTTHCIQQRNTHRNTDNMQRMPCIHSSWCLVNQKVLSLKAPFLKMILKGNDVF